MSGPLFIHRVGSVAYHCDLAGFWRKQWHVFLVFVVVLV